MRVLLVLIGWLAAASACASTPAEAVALALTDCRAQPPGLQPYLRYLWLPNLPDKEREAFLKVLAFQANSLSSEPEIVLPVLVNKDLIRLNVVDYGEKAWTAAWERLGDHDPYFHVQLKTEVIEFVEIDEIQEYGYWQLNGRPVEKGTKGATWLTTRIEKTGKKIKQPTGKKAAKTTTAAAPWLNTAGIAELVVITHSSVPIVRADWWLSWTAIQEGRDGSGYYDFLGLKSRADLEKLVGLDREAAKRRRKEIAAAISKSGVALNNRQVIRLGSLNGGYWYTLDVESSVDKDNALRLLNGDFANHKAEEIYGVLDNGLFVTVASGADGVLQNVVPDKIASDHASTTNDRRIHPGLSCIRCHSEGLRPIDDWARKLYRGNPIVLQSPDYAKLKRLRQLYLSDLPKLLKQDQTAYAEVLLVVNGLSPAANAKSYGDQWHKFNEESVMPEEASQDWGLKTVDFLGRLKAYAVRTGQIDPVLAGFLATPAIGMRREHYEELQPVIYQIIGVRP